MTKIVKKRKKNYNMCLSKNYCPDWKNWHVLREFVQNIRDADPNHTIEFPTPDSVVMKTATTPTLSQMLMMGEGTKAGDTETIGEFGEGSKIACLAAARSRAGLKIRTPEGTWTFALKTAKGFDCPSLHAILDPNEPIDGCEVSFKAKDLEKTYKENFVTEYGIVGDGGESMRIYVKGIFVCDFPEKCLHDWNLRDITLNRDRSIPNIYDIKREIGKAYIKEAMESPSKMAAIFDDMDVFEAKAMDWAYPTTSECEMFAETFCETFGDKAVLASDDQKKNALAQYKGYKVITVPNHLTPMVSKIKRAEDCGTTREEYKEVSKIPYFHAMSEIDDIVQNLGMSNNVIIFKEDQDRMGFYDQADGTIGISEALFKPEQRVERLATLLHEAAHHISKASDLDANFEDALSNIAGKMAAKAYEGYTEW